MREFIDGTVGGVKVNRGNCIKPSTSTPQNASSELFFPILAVKSEDILMGKMCKINKVV